jgi:hypothetical protein
MEFHNVFISSGVCYHISYQQTEESETNYSKRKTNGTPDSFTHFAFGLLNLGYEYKQFQGFSTAVSLQYSRSLFSRGIPEKGKNYFGFKVGFFFKRVP